MVKMASKNTTVNVTTLILGAGELKRLKPGIYYHIGTRSILSVI